MKKALLMAALAAAVVGGALGCGGGRSGVKPAPLSVSTFTDTRDGQVYKIVKIGRQVWFAENLNYGAEGSSCYENNADSCAKYGRLYDWNTAMKTCPAGTHLPTDKEWTTLVKYVGGDSTAAMNLKSRTGWNSYKGKSGNGTDIYGFSALAGGYGYGGDDFDATGSYGYWWSATEHHANEAWFREMNSSGESVWRLINSKTPTLLYSVRCVADNRKEAQK